MFIFISQLYVTEDLFEGWKIVSTDVNDVFYWDSTHSEQNSMKVHMQITDSTTRQYIYVSGGGGRVRRWHA